jgi:hypothetical protein
MAFQTMITQLLDAHHTPYRLLPHSEPVFTFARFKWRNFGFPPLDSHVAGSRHT